MSPSLPDPRVCDGFNAPRDFWLFLIMVVAAASVLCWFAEMALPRPFFFTLFALSMVGFIASLGDIAKSVMPEEMDPTSDLDQPLSRDPLLPPPPPDSAKSDEADAEQQKGGREWQA